MPEHLTQIIERQHPGVALDIIKLSDAPTTRVGGIPNGDDPTKITIQDMDATLLLRLELHVGDVQTCIDIRLVFKIKGLDGTPEIETDMFIESNE